MILGQLLQRITILTLICNIFIIPSAIGAFAGWGPPVPQSSTTKIKTNTELVTTSSSKLYTKHGKDDYNNARRIRAVTNLSLSAVTEQEEIVDERETISSTTREGQEIVVVNDESSSSGSTTIANNYNNEEDHLKTSDILSLESIRSTLIRQEETIIFALIERAQFRYNSIVYKKNGFGNLGYPPGSTQPPPPSEGYDNTEQQQLSFLEYMLVGTETLHCCSRRYQSPEEHPFFPDRLPSGPLENLPKLQYPDLLSSEGGACDVNFNKRLLQTYIQDIVPKICQHGDDEQHGSTALCDIAVLQALSRRVHYGKFVAESKYRSDPEGYQKLVEADDADGVMKLLTNAKVEEKVLRRARLKAATYGSEPLLTELPPIEGSDRTSTLVAAAAASAVVAALSALDKRFSQRAGKVDPSVIEDFYRDIIIPMTKDIEVAYLFRRCGKEPPPQYHE